MPEGQFLCSDFDELLVELSQTAGALEIDGAWPANQLQRLAETGVLGWVIPEQWGGGGFSTQQLMFGYEKLAQSCLVTAFVLTQRNGACQRIAGAENKAMQAALLPALCRGEVFATIGISHLTTSRQHLSKPSVRVRRRNGAYLFNGLVPWVTGAKYADFILTGGTCDDNQQILAVIPMSSAGLTVEEPEPLLALNASQTGPVRFENVEIDEQHLVVGPAEQVIKRGSGGGAGSLMTSALALGAAADTLKRFQSEAKKRLDLVEIHQTLAYERKLIASDLYAAARSESAEKIPSLSTESIRQRANSLVLRSAQAYLVASKGAGFVAGHPANRAVREAMFFLVWSCPQPVLTATLREFTCVLKE